MQNSKKKNGQERRSTAVISNFTISERESLDQMIQKHNEKTNELMNRSAFVRKLVLNYLVATVNNSK